MTVSGTQLVEDLKLAAKVFGVDIREFVAPDNRHVIAGSIRLHLLDWAADGKPAILFFHGNGLTAHTWDLAVLQLRSDYHCLAADLRGHGESEWSPAMEYGPQHHAADIGNLADALGLERFVLVGMSLGGMASILYAGESSDRLAAFVCVDIAPGAMRAGPRPGVARVGNFIQMQHEMDSVEHFVDQAIAFNPRRDRELLRRSLLHNLRQLPDGKWTWKYDRRHHERPGMFMAGAGNLGERLSASVGGIKCPTLVVRGAESDVLAAEDAQAFAAALPDGRWVEVPGAGHTVQGDNPSGFASVVREFLSGAGI